MWISIGIVIGFVVGHFFTKFVGDITGPQNTKESTPSASHNSASDESLQYLEMAKGAIRGKGYITAIGYIDAAIANLRT